ncbi:hypothetical protein ACP4OV_019878 [Aristida adscensionis]
MGISSSSSRRSRRRPGDGLSPSPPGNRRDFSALPPDVLLAIFSRVPQADVLRAAGLVCASWRRTAVAEPVLWRHIDLTGDENSIDGEKDETAGWQTMARAAVDRSAGQCESFRGRADVDVLAYLAARSPSLRSIHVTNWFSMSPASFVEEVIKKLPLLERLVLECGYFSESSEVMRAFLDHCPRLEVLDAGGCYNSYAMGKRLRARCERTIKHLRMPRDAPGSCSCCVQYAQKCADEEDD